MALRTPHTLGLRTVPVALMMAGSGSTDRDGNASVGLETNTYRELAQAFSAHNIASLRYDERGVGQSARAGVNEIALRTARHWRTR
jgi:predicted alpha/beta hydrolase